MVTYRNVCVYICIHGLVYIHLYLFVLLARKHKRNIPKATSVLSIKTWFLVSFSNIRSQNFLGEISDCKTGGGNIQDEPRASCSLMSESREMHTKIKITKTRNLQ